MKKSASKFLLVGLGSFFIDYGVTLFLHYVFDVTGYIASAIGFTLGFIFSFTLSRRWVFRQKAMYKFSTKNQLTMYFVLATFNLVVSTIIVAWLGNMEVDVYISKAFVVALIACENFIVGHYIIFAKKSDNN
jgi:putative flippase GtrA